MEATGPPSAPSFNRVTMVSGGDASKIDDGVRRFREEALPVAKAQPGFQAGVLLVDRENNLVIAVSAWDSKEHREASDPALSPLRAAAAEAAGGQGSVMLTETTHADLKIPVNR